MKRSVKEVAEFVGARAVGDTQAVISGIASIPLASAGDLVFVEDAAKLQEALASPAVAVICGEFGDLPAAKKALLVAAQPRLAFARAAKFLRPRPARAGSVHPTAVVHPSARLAAGVTIEAHAVLAEEVTVGAGTNIGAGCALAAGVHIGQECDLYPNVSVYAGTRIGDRVIIHAGAVLGSDGFGYVRDRTTRRQEKFPQVGRLEIEDDVEIGANTSIDRGALEVTRIGRGTKIDNLVHIGHNCRLGENVVIAAQTGLSGSIVLENDVVLGGQVGIGEHARVGEGVMLGGQGGVLPKKVLRGKGVVFWGTPATPLRVYLKQLAALARLAKRS